MSQLRTTQNLDKDLLVDKIVEQFRRADQLYFKRSLLEFFDDQGQFIGDNLFETTFKLRPGQAPLIYEVSGPYDTVSKQYATIAKIYHRGELEFQCDLKAGIFQRTAAMAWIYLDALKHAPGRTLLVGAGKVGLENAAYLKHFSPGLEQIDYQDLARMEAYEQKLADLGIRASYQESPVLSQYDTIIMATTANGCLIHPGNFASLKPGSVVISLCTTSPTGEIDPEIYGLDVNTFLDYELTKTFTGDMQKANDLGNLERAILFQDLLEGKTSVDTEKKVNLVRLTGTPMQNIAVVDMLLEKENIRL